MNKIIDIASADFPTFEETKVPVARARHAPGFIYTSPEIFELEKEKIFMKDWLCVGREEEIEKPGDYMTLRILNEPVLIARGLSGQVNAFSNMCAHRGVEVASGSGNRKAFSCPFHGWSYDLQGKLIGAPHMREAEGFDAANCQLPRLRVDMWQGWIFINFDDHAGPLSEFVAPLERDFSYLRQEDCRLGIKTVCELDCNWKLVVENLIDFYHLNVVHTTTNGRKFTKEAFKLSRRERGGYSAEYNSGPSNFASKPVFGRMPWLEDKPDDFSVTGLLAPNFTFFARVDTIHPVVTWPLGLNKTRVIVYSLLPKIYFDEPDFNERVKAYQEYQTKVMSEDREMLESIQNGLASTRFQPGRMAPIEHGVQQVLTGYLDRMFGAA